MLNKLKVKLWSMPLIKLKNKYFRKKYGPDWEIMRKYKIERTDSGLKVVPLNDTTGYYNYYYHYVFTDKNILQMRKIENFIYKLI